MKLLVYGINYSPEATGIGKYSGEMARWLSTKGHSIRVVTATPYYPHWEVHASYRGRLWQRSIEDGVLVTRCPLFVPSKPNTLTRMLHLTSFAITSFFPVLAQHRWKPDVILLVIPTLLCAPTALLLSRLCGARCVLHIQDFEVDALFGLGLARSGLLKKVASRLERWLLRRFDTVFTISDSMVRRAQLKGIGKERAHLFPNWANLGHFRNATPSTKFMQNLGVPIAKQIALYSGNMGDKQGLELVLQAAASLRHRTDLHFLLVGEGAGKQSLLKLADELGLDNLSFAPLQAWEAMPIMLASAAAHLVIQKHGAADAVLPSKLSNILAVGGNSVITADSNTSLGQLCNDFCGIAIRVEPESLNALVAGIEKCLLAPYPNLVARKYAEQFLDKENILQQFESKLLALTSQHRTRHGQ